MTLNDLAKTYREDQKTLEKQIRNLREKSKNYTGAQKHMANRNLLCLYEMRREAENTARILENYYSDKTEKKIYHKKQNFYAIN